MTTLTYDDFTRMQKQFHDDFVKPMARSVLGMQIIEDPRMTEAYTETVIFKGHPIVQWLAKYFSFDPDITVAYERLRPSREVIRVGSMFVMHPATTKQLREQPLQDVR